MKELTQEKSASNGLGHALDKGMVLLLVSAAVIGIMYFLAQGNERFLYVLSNGLPPLVAFAAFVAATAGLVRNGVRIKDRVSVAWLGYSLGMLLWLLAESTWGVYTLWYSIPVPFPSPADGFWLAGYVPLMCAIVIQVWPFREFFSSRKMLTVIATVFVLASLLLAALIPPTYASEVGHGLVSIGVSLAYPLLDVILLVFAFPILFLFGRGTFWRPFLFVRLE